MKKSLHEGSHIKIVYPEQKDILLLQQASVLITLFAEMGLMIEQTVETLSAMAAQGLLALAIDETNLVVGSAAITVHYPGGVSEFGGWAVLQQHQKTGVGKELLIGLLKKTKAKKIIAFGNHNSTPIFLKMGGKVLDQKSLHPDAFVPCLTCNCKGKEKLQGGQKCVDTIVDLTPIIKQQKKGKV